MKFNNYISLFDIISIKIKNKIPIILWDYIRNYKNVITNVNILLHILNNKIISSLFLHFDTNQISKYKILRLLSNNITLIIDKKNINLLDSLKIIRIASTPKYFINNTHTNLFKYNLTKTSTTESQSIYRFRFSNTIIIGGSNIIILDNNYVIYELTKFYKNNKNIIFRYDYAIEAINSATIIIEQNSVTKSEKNGIKLVTNFSWNYYHFMYEVVPLFNKIDEAKLDNKIPLIIDRSCCEVKNFKEIIDFLNKDKRKIITIDNGEHVAIENLYYFSPLNIIPPQFKYITKIKANDVLFDLNSLKYIQTSILEREIANKKFPKRIYLSRENSGLRRKFNESEVIELVKQNKFEIMYPENYSIFDQAKMFNDAEFIIGATGAAMTNIVFCNSNCKIICLTNFNIPFSGFSTIANFTGAEMIYLSDSKKQVTKYSDIHESFNIDTIELKQLINTMSETNKPINE